jgi:hypothetical protein
MKTFLNSDYSHSILCESLPDLCEICVKKKVDGVGDVDNYLAL